MAHERKNIKRNKSRPKVAKKGLVQTETINRKFPYWELSVDDQRLYKLGLY